MRRFRTSLPRPLLSAAVLYGFALVGCSDSVAPRPDGPPDPLTVSVPFCDAIAPRWVAFQDGDGEWTRAQPDERDGLATYRFDFVHDRGAIAVVLPLLVEDHASVLQVLYGAPEELAQVQQTNPFLCDDDSLRTWRGGVAGLNAGDEVLLSGGFFSQQAVPPASEFTLPGIPGTGPQDLLASRTTTTTDGARALTGIILRRGIDLPDGGRLPDLDFASAEAFAPASAQLTLVGGTVGVVGNLTLLTSHGAMVLDTRADDPTATTRSYLAIPESRLLLGDLQHLQLFTDGNDHAGRTADVYFRAPVDRTVTFGAPLDPPTITAAASTPSPRLRAHFSSQDDYGVVTSIVYQQTFNPTVINVVMTGKYAERSGGYDLVVPDLSAVPGFDPGWTLRTGTQIGWSAERVGGTVPFGPSTAYGDGMHAVSAFRSGSVAAP
jgi:hypothetical protein